MLEGFTLSTRAGHILVLMSLQSQVDACALGHRGSQSVDTGQAQCLLCPRGQQTSPEWGEKSEVSRVSESKQTKLRRESTDKGPFLGMAGGGEGGELTLIWPVILFCSQGLMKALEMRKCELCR